ncbi:MAG: hypothetical protein ACJAU6_003374 [Alphaproteobacteria bacterium]|jgi:hypothetical protein
MNDSAQVPVMQELLESEASGDVAVIYEEARQFCGVPYVSSMHRYLATMPGCLKWVWSALRPALANGVIQEAAWDCVNSLSLAPMAPVSRSALRLFGVNAADEVSIRAACDTFVRVSPINLVFGACLRRILMEPHAPAETAVAAGWTAPAPYKNLPGFAESANLDDDQAAVLSTFTRPLGAGEFIPGPYRMFANWPAYLAHVSVELSPILAGTGYAKDRETLFQAVDVAASKVALGLPAAPEGRPSDKEADLICAAAASYRQTSAEMVIAGTLLRNALPSPK